jgi:hypothetical protein
MTTAPDPLARHRKAWSRYSRADRRRIMRAVNRLEPLADPAEAALAVFFARRQRRMWTRFGWVYPLIPALVALPRGWQAVAVNAAVGAVLVVAIGAAFVWRARRSEQIQLEVVHAAQRRKRSGSPRTKAKAPKPRGPANRRKGRQR